MNKHDIVKLFAFIGMIASFLAAAASLAYFIYQIVHLEIMAKECNETPYCIDVGPVHYGGWWLILIPLGIGLGFLFLWLWKKEEMDDLPPI